MSGDAARQAADRKAILLARAELDRVRIQLALHEIRNVVAPPGREARAEGRRPLAATLLAVAVPLIGASRLARWLRMGSMLIAAVRIARDWQRGR